MTATAIADGMVVPMAEHHFNVEVATEYGVNAAILLNHLAFWIAKNEANGTNFYDGMYWTYNSRKAMTVLFPYLGEKQVRNAIDKLVENGLVVTGNYNQKQYDRTIWYALTPKGKSICLNGKCNVPKGQMEDAERANAMCQKGKPIPDNKPYNIPDNKTDIYNAVVAHLNNVCGTKYKPTSKKTQTLIKARLNEGFTLEDFKTVINKKNAEWGKDQKMAQYLRPETLFGTKFEWYLNQRQQKTAEGLLDPDDDVNLNGIF